MIVADTEDELRVLPAGCAPGDDDEDEEEDEEVDEDEPGPESGLIDLDGRITLNVTACT